MPSDFTIGDPRGAFWFARDPAGTPYRVSTNGNVFVRALQTLLQDEPTAASFDGNRYGGDMVSVDGRWGPITSRVLWNALRRNGAPDALLTAVAADAGWASRTQRIQPRLRTGSIAAAVWLIHRGDVGSIPGGVDASRLSVPPDAAPPVWRVEPSYASDGGPMFLVTSLAPSEPQASAPPVSETTTPGVAPVIDPEPVPEPPTADVTDDIRRPTGISVSGGGGSQVPWGILLGVGAAVVAIAWMTSSPSSSGRRRSRAR